MEMEHVQGGDLGILGPDDDAARLAQVVQRAIDEGDDSEGMVLFSIPVEEEMTYWGTGIWNMAGDGTRERANVLFAEEVSKALGRDIVIFGCSSRPNTQTGEHRYFISGLTPVTPEQS